MNGIPYSTWQKNTDDAVFSIPANNSPICNITNKVLFAYALRLVNANYNGALIRVRRSRDNAELDIYPNQFGLLDTITLQNFCLTGTGFVTRWYDQSGFARNATQGTAIGQPIIIFNGELLKKNGIPILSRGSGTGGGNRTLIYTAAVTGEMNWTQKPYSILLTHHQRSNSNSNPLFELRSTAGPITFSINNAFSLPGTSVITNASYRMRYALTNQLDTSILLKRTPYNNFLMLYFQGGGSARTLYDSLGNGFGSAQTSTTSAPSTGIVIGSTLTNTGFFGEVYVFDGLLNPQSISYPTNLINGNIPYQYDETFLNIVKNVAKYHSIGLPI